MSKPSRYRKPKMRCPHCGASQFVGRSRITFRKKKINGKKLHVPVAHITALFRTVHTH